MALTSKCGVPPSITATPALLDSRIPTCTHSMLREGIPCGLRTQARCPDHAREITKFGAENLCAVGRCRKCRHPRTMNCPFKEQINRLDNAPSQDDGFGVV